MRRRDFMKVVSAGILAWPLAARGQQSGKTWRLGFIAHRYESFYDGLFEGLRELGYVEGQNLIVERRYAEGHAERFQDFAAEMVRLKADIVIVVTTPAALAVKNACPHKPDRVSHGAGRGVMHPSAA
jgi:putative ABC transport system substrate-binding protein